MNKIKKMMSSVPILLVILFVPALAGLDEPIPPIPGYGADSAVTRGGADDRGTAPGLSGLEQRSPARGRRSPERP